MGRKTLTVSETTFERMEEHRKDGESWDEYHRRMLNEHELYSRLKGLLEEMSEMTSNKTAKKFVEMMKDRGGGQY